MAGTEDAEAVVDALSAEVFDSADVPRAVAGDVAVRARGAGPRSAVLFFAVFEGDVFLRVVTWGQL